MNTVLMTPSAPISAELMRTAKPGRTKFMVRSSANAAFSLLRNTGLSVALASTAAAASVTSTNRERYRRKTHIECLILEPAFDRWPLLDVIS